MTARARHIGAWTLGIGMLLAGAGYVAAEGGGTVTNALPTVPTFANALGATTTLNAVDTISGTVHDTNGEGDIQQVRVYTSSGPSVSATRAITAADLAATAKPAAFTGGWKVWNPTADDGRISWEYSHAYTSLGTYVLHGAAKDEGAEQAAAAAITVLVADAIQVAQDPVSLAGASLDGARWGAWSALPGASAVPGTNFLKVTNVGTVATQAFTVDFSASAFAGATDATKSILIDGNIQFSWWEDTTPGTSAPSEGTFPPLAASATGSVTPQFTGTGNVIYVTYQLANLPTPLPDQGYGAGYTVTAV